MNVILHPAAKQFTSQDDFHGASIQSVAAFLPYLKTEVDRATLRAEFPSGKLFCRGAVLGGRARNLPFFEKIAQGDLAVFFRDKRMVGSGRVVLKLHDKTLAENLGGFGALTPGSPHELIYVVKDVREQNIPVAEVQKQLRYGQNDQLSFMVVKDSVVASEFIEWLDGLAAPSKEELIRLMRSPDAKETDRRAFVNSRLEQSYWRRELFGKRSLGECDICNTLLPVEYLVAAHVKPRHRCTHEERLDPNNIIAACSLGCDALFEKRAISVKNGFISSDLEALASRDLRQRVASLVGKACKRWSPQSARYFTEHQG